MDSIFSFVNSPQHLSPTDLLELLVRYFEEINTQNSHLKELVRLASMDMVDRFIAEPFKLMSRFKKQEEVEEHVY